MKNPAQPKLSKSLKTISIIAIAVGIAVSAVFYQDSLHSRGQENSQLRSPLPLLERQQGLVLADKDSGVDPQILGLENTLLRKRIHLLEQKLEATERSLHLLQLTGFPTPDSPHFVRLKGLHRKLKEREEISRGLLAIVDILDSEREAQQETIGHLENSVDILAYQLEHRKQKTDTIHQHLRGELQRLQASTDEQEKTRLATIQELDSQLQNYRDGYQQKSAKLANAEERHKELEHHFHIAAKARWDVEDELKATREFFYSAIESERTINELMKKDIAVAEQLQHTAYRFARDTEEELRKAINQANVLNAQQSYQEFAHNNKDLQIDVLLASLNDLRLSQPTLQQTLASQEEVLSSLEAKLQELEKAKEDERVILVATLQNEELIKQRLEEELQAARKSPRFG